ncbi:DUF6482 family protein [uncultured Vibrio sp.]|uniref:DUF6482 family protein n=1 Tax=uncultured Vibrio sp. TaxID=114054 RepID=UPI0025DB3C22|nr:DUF6482 family protein [uncultured Vibrio sp.]
MDILVESLEGGMYLAFSVQGEQKRALLDGKSQPIKFNSIEQVREYCGSMHIEKALLQHNSAYDEMCGSPSMGRNSMTIDLNWH